MDGRTIIGCGVLAASLCLLIWLVAWSRRAINRIAHHDLRSARDIVKELRHGS